MPRPRLRLHAQLHALGADRPAADCLKQCGAQCGAGESYGDIVKSKRNYTALMEELGAKVRWVGMNHGADSTGSPEFWGGLALFQSLSSQSTELALPSR